MPWKRGAVAHPQGPPFFSATRTEIVRKRDLLGIVLGGLRLRSTWPANPGSIGMQITLDLRRRVSWSLSAWESAADLQRFVRSEHHQRILAPYREHVRVRATRWSAERLDLQVAWETARTRLDGE